jgi:hypothetical protein
LGTSLRRIKYPVKRIDLRTEVANLITARNLTKAPLPLEDLHRRVPLAYQLPFGTQHNKLNANIKDTIPSMSLVYRELVKYIAREVLGFDVVFEANPPLRFHFPVPMPDRFRSKDGIVLAHHTDTLLGSSFEEINCWVPFTACFETCALQCASLADSILILTRFASEFDFDEKTYVTGRERFFRKLYSDDSLQRFVLQRCRPVPLDYGELIMFDSRTVHSTAENVEDVTRMSLDFRLIPLKAHEAAMRRLAARGESPLEFSGLTMVRGSFFDKLTAFQLESAW